MIFEVAESVQLDCVAEGVPAVEYTWQKNGEEFERNAANIEVIPGTGSFIFKEVYAFDEGIYIYSYRQCDTLQKA